MTEEEQGYYWFKKLIENTLSVSKPIGDNKEVDGRLVNRRVRAVSMKLGLSSDLRMKKRIEAKEGIEVHLKTTDKADQEIKAYFYEDSKNVQTLTVQRWMVKSGNPHKESMVLYGEQLDLLLQFVKAFRGVPEGQGRVEIPLNVALDKIEEKQSIDSNRVAAYLQENPNFLKSIIENDIGEQDLIAIGYRKRQLEIYRELLESDDVAESDWQKFFEKNTWIFGYGLSYIFQTSLDDKKMEQVVQVMILIMEGRGLMDC